MNDQPEAKLMAGVTRAEIISVSAFALNVATLIFGLGVVWADVQDQRRRISLLETSNGELVQKVERIDANVSFLADLAREERQRNRP